MYARRREPGLTANRVNVIPPFEPDLGLRNQSIYRRSGDRSAGAGSGVSMPLLRYFLYVGGSLLALLLFANAEFSTAPLPSVLTSDSELPAVRIHSEQKLPERVVFDTRVVPPAPVPT